MLHFLLRGAWSTEHRTHTRLDLTDTGAGASASSHIIATGGHGGSFRQSFLFLLDRAFIDVTNLITFFPYTGMKISTPEMQTKSSSDKPALQFPSQRAMLLSLPATTTLPWLVLT